MVDIYNKETESMKGEKELKEIQAKKINQKMTLIVIKQTLKFQMIK